MFQYMEGKFKDEKQGILERYQFIMDILERMTLPNKRQYEENRLKLKNSLTDFLNHINTVNRNLTKVYEFKISILVFNSKIVELDGFEKWRHYESQKLNTDAQNWLMKIQTTNQENQLCIHKMRSGFGCQIHGLTHILYMASLTGIRTNVKITHWPYTSKLYKYVLPLTTLKHPQAKQKTKEFNYPGSMTVFVPEHLAQRAALVKENPTLWWMSQLVISITFQNLNLKFKYD